MYTKTAEKLLKGKKVASVKADKKIMKVIFDDGTKLVVGTRGDTWAVITLQKNGKRISWTM